MRVVSASTGLLAPSPESAGSDESTLRAQLDAGLDLVAAGSADPATLLAGPLADHPATRPGDAAPYPYADRSYRPPVLTDGLSPDGGTAAGVTAVTDATATLRDRGLDPRDRLQAVLPGPYTLAGLARDEHYGDRAGRLDAVAEFLAAEAAALPPVAAIALLEPRLVADPPGDGADARASAAVDAVAAAADAPVVVHCPGGALTAKVHAHLLDADLSAVGYDFTADHDASRSLVGEFGTADSVAVGVVDAHDPEVESADTVAERLAWVLDGLPPAMAFDAVYATPGDSLHRLSREAAAGKLRALAEGVAAWRDQAV
jgi:5-methyltetrahydropteroyltriglutamate--homocysteine methyltransferase